MMTIFDRLVLLATGLVCIYMIYFLISKVKKEESCCFSGRFLYLTSFAVLLVSGLLLIGLGWDILANPLVAIVATLIPFSFAAGLVMDNYPKIAKVYLGLVVIAFISVVITKLGGFWCSKIVYPVTHATAGFTILLVPIFKYKAQEAKAEYMFVSLGGTLIGLGGIALAFLSLGKQLLFFSHEFVLMILAPLLFFVALSYALGLIKGK